MTFFDLVLQARSSLHPDGEPDDFISSFSGVIRAEDDAGRVRTVGKVHAYRIQAELAAAHGESLFDVCDAHSDEMHRLHTLFYEPGTYQFREPFVDRLHAVDSDLLVLDYVLLHPKWRGLRLGLLAARKMVDLLGGGCGLTVCDIAPLNADASEFHKVPPSWFPRHPTREVRREATRKLRQHFRQMGFRRLARTRFSVLPMALTTPTLSELLKPRK